MSDRDAWRPRRNHRPRRAPPPLPADGSAAPPPRPVWMNVLITLGVVLGAVIVIACALFLLLIAACFGMLGMH